MDKRSKEIYDTYLNLTTKKFVKVEMSKELKNKLEKELKKTFKELKDECKEEHYNKVKNSIFVKDKYLKNIFKDNIDFYDKSKDVAIIRGELTLCPKCINVTSETITHTVTILPGQPRPRTHTIYKCGLGLKPKTCKKFYFKYITND